MPHLVEEAEEKIEEAKQRLPDKLPIQFVTYGEYIVVEGNLWTRLGKALEVFILGRFLVQFREPRELPVVKQDNPLGIEYISEDVKGKAVDY